MTTVVVRRVLLLRDPAMRQSWLIATETVSTDYDTSDRLYFEPLTEEFVSNIIIKEKSKPNRSDSSIWEANSIKLSKFLHKNKFQFLELSTHLSI